MMLLYYDNRVRMVEFSMIILDEHILISLVFRLHVGAFI